MIFCAARSRSSVAFAGHAHNACVFEQILAHLRRVHAADVEEHPRVERALGLQAAHAGDSVERPGEQVAAIGVGLAHLLGFVLAVEGFDGALLQKAAHAGQAVLIQLIGRVEDRLGRGQIAHAPARHGHALGKAVHRGDAVADGGIAAHADAFDSVVDELFIDLVAEHVDVRVAQHERFEDVGLVLVEDTAGGVIGIVDDEQAGLVGAGRLKRFGGDAVVLLIVELDLDGDAARGLHDRLIGHPRRVEHEHLVALIQDGLYGEIDGVLAAGGDENAVFVVLQPVLLAQLLRDGRAQLGKARPHDVVRDSRA